MTFFKTICHWWHEGPKSKQVIKGLFSFSLSSIHFLIETIFAGKSQSQSHQKVDERVSGHFCPEKKGQQKIIGNFLFNFDVKKIVEQNEPE